MLSETFFLSWNTGI